LAASLSASWNIEMKIRLSNTNMSTGINFLQRERTINSKLVTYQKLTQVENHGIVRQYIPIISHITLLSLMYPK
jgi:hypothetical protein